VIAVLTRIPEPRRAKTRLIPALGVRGAAFLARAMAEDVLETVRESGLPWTLCVDGDLDHPWVQAMSEGANAVEAQPWGDLGARIRHALRDGGVAIGTDAPTLPVAMIREAHASTADLVVAPAFDGGYVLVGVNAGTVARGVFDDVPWSSPETFAAQVERARAMDLSLRVLPFWYDVDLPSDLDRLRIHLRTLPLSTAPRTRAFLESRHASPDR
jgi:rSAM/selenodomain-associated transferase 1